MADLRAAAIRAIVRRHPYGRDLERALGEAYDCGFVDGSLQSRAATVVEAAE